MTIIIKNHYLDLLAEVASGSQEAADEIAAEFERVTNERAESLAWVIQECCFTEEIDDSEKENND